MSIKGRLLISMPILQDVNFLRSIVFMIEHNDEGALGVIINRPLELPARDLLERWSEVFGDAMLSEGGPVSKDSAICLASPRAESFGEEITPITDGIVAVNLEADPAITAAYVGAVRVFIGYAGWGADQLEAEIEQGAWQVCDGSAADLFELGAARAWETVLRRQPGRMSWLASYPLDPRMN